MFAPFCPAHQSRVLLSHGNIELLVNSETGIDIHYRCICGHRGVWRTGRARCDPQSEACDSQPRHEAGQRNSTRHPPHEEAG